MARIRLMSVADLSEAETLLTSSRQWLDVWDSAEELHRQLESNLEAGSLFVAEQESQVAGVVSFISEPVFAKGGILRFIVVREDLRRTGVGKQIMGFVERKVFRESHNLYVWLSASNSEACSFFTKLQYAKVGEIPDFSGRGGSVWIMRKSNTPVARGDSR